VKHEFQAYPQSQALILFLRFVITSVIRIRVELWQLKILHSLSRFRRASRNNVRIHSIGTIGDYSVPVLIMKAMNNRQFFFTT